MHLSNSPEKTAADAGEKDGNDRRPARVNASVRPIGNLSVCGEGKNKPSV